MTDTNTSTVAPAVNPNTFNPLVVGATSIPPGTPLYGTGGGVEAARANAIGTARLVGVAASAASHTPPGQRVHAQYAGLLELTTAEWDAIAGTTGGLTPNTTYYLSTAADGKIQSTLPTSPNYVCKVGTALSGRIMLIQLGGPTLGLGG